VWRSDAADWEGTEDVFDHGATVTRRTRKGTPTGLKARFRKEREPRYGPIKRIFGDTPMKTFAEAAWDRLTEAEKRMVVEGLLEMKDVVLVETVEPASSVQLIARAREGVVKRCFVCMEKGNDQHVAEMTDGTFQTMVCDSCRPLVNAMFIVYQNLGVAAMEAAQAKRGSTEAHVG
jgi:hypothetical protein